MNRHIFLLGFFILLSPTLEAQSLIYKVCANGSYEDCVDSTNIKSRKECSSWARTKLRDFLFRQNRERFRDQESVFSRCERVTASATYLDKRSSYSDEAYLYVYCEPRDPVALLLHERLQACQTTSKMHSELLKLVEGDAAHVDPDAFYADAFRFLDAYLTLWNAGNCDELIEELQSSSIKAETSFPAVERLRCNEIDD